MRIFLYTGFLVLLMAACEAVQAQKTYVITADSVKITNCDSAELILENHTQGVKGFLYNKGNGRTIFKQALVKVNDSIYVIGADTFRYNAWVQGGNRLAKTGILGTLDVNHLDLYTSGLSRARVTSGGNVVVGNTTTDNGKKLQVNGTLSVSDTSYLSGYILTSNAYNSTLKGDGGRSLLIGSPGAANTGSSGFNNSGSGSVIIHSPLTTYAGIGGTIKNSVLIGGNSAAWSGPDSNTLVIAKDMGYDQIYNGTLVRPNVLALGGSAGMLRDDNTGGSSYLLGNFKGNIYFGYDINNWMYFADAPTNYIQIGGSNHNLLALFGGFHAQAPYQSTLAGPSQRPETSNVGFPTGSYFRVGAGRGIGNGLGTDLRLAVAPPGTSGGGINSYVDAITIAASNAYVGVGTSSPSAQLHTTGSVRLAGLTNDNTQTRVVVSDANGNLYYRTLSTWAGDDILRSSLAVNGPIRAKSLTLDVAGGGWPDYVFDSSYRLPDLREVGTYIKGHGHLPGVVSAAEVSRSGIDVGASQAVLLKKIEELTLYVIQQDEKLKELDELKKEIEILKKQINSKTSL